MVVMIRTLGPLSALDVRARRTVSILRRLTSPRHSDDASSEQVPDVVDRVFDAVADVVRDVLGTADHV
jgi:hypothetical protein